MFVQIKEAIDNYRGGCKAKCAMSTPKLLVKSVFAGIMIGLGAAASSVVAHNISNVGLARLTAAIVFPVGLMMVIFMGAELFTGDCLIVMGLPKKDISPVQMIKTLVLVYLGNFIGGILLSGLIIKSGQLDYSKGLLGAYTMNVALNKVCLTPGKAICSGILCNILVCAAVLMAGCAKDAAGKILVSFFVIMLFVTAGFEHCVANMYYITAGLMAKLNPSYVAKAIEIYGLTSNQIELLNIKNMIVNNLIPVTIGNIIGGSLFVGLPFYYLNKDINSAKDIKEDKKNDGFHNELTPDIIH